MDDAAQPARAPQEFRDSARHLATAFKRAYDAYLTASMPIVKGLLRDARGHLTGDRVICTEEKHGKTWHLVLRRDGPLVRVVQERPDGNREGGFVVFEDSLEEVFNRWHVEELMLGLRRAFNVDEERELLEQYQLSQSWQERLQQALAS
jgi:hypothetical protein